MKKGDVLFYKGTSLISRAIAWVTKSPYTHVALAVGDDMVIEADRFIQTRVRSIRTSEVFEVYEFEGITDDQRGRMVNAAKQLIGYPYDYTQILRNFIRLTFGSNLPAIEAANANICSDIIDVPAYIANIERIPLFEVGDVTPAELFVIYRLRKIDGNGLL